MKNKTIKTTSSSMPSEMMVGKALEGIQIDNTSSKINCFLYGDYKWNEYKDEEYGSYGSYSKALVIKGEAQQAILNNFYRLDISEMVMLLCATSIDVTSYDYMIKGFNLDELTEYSSLKATTRAKRYLEKLSPLFGRTYFYVNKQDVKNIFDFNKVVGLHFKQSNIKQCKTCLTHYYQHCACLDNAKHKNIINQTKMIKFCDIKNDVELFAPSSINAINRENRAFIGFEWELGYAIERTSTQQITNKLYKLFKKHSLIDMFGEVMEDGSISEHYTKGSEIPSYPISEDYYNKHKDNIEEVSDKFNAMNVLGSKLGFHIHLSRDSFATSEHLERWLGFMTSSAKILLQLSGRASGNFNQWASLRLPSAYYARNKSGNEVMTTPKLLKKLACDVLDGKTFGDKYNYLNFQKKHTIEYRLPASSTGSDSNLEFSKMGRHLELIFASYNYTKEHSDLSFAKFIEWCSKANYINLYNAICSNDNLLEEVCNSAEFNAIQSLSAPNINLDELDISNSDDLEAMKKEFEEFTKQAENIGNTSDEAKEIVNKHKGKKIKKNKGSE